MDEYERAARDLREHLEGLDRREAIALACRGTGDPAALAWLAEALELDAGQRVLDVGGGTGGPAAWLVDRYGVEVVVTDPSTAALEVAATAFGLPTVAMTGDRPGVDARFDVCLALGVLSVVDRRRALLAELRALSDRCGLLVWCATDDHEFTAGGSTFPPLSDLGAMLADAGWRIDAGPEAPDLPEPPPWRRLDGPAPQPDEKEVAAAIEDGAVHPRLVVCRG